MYKYVLVSTMRKIILLLLVFAMALSVTYPCTAKGAWNNASTEGKDALNLKSKSVILIEAGSGNVLYEKDADMVLKPASVTKVMTLLLVFEAMEAGRFTLEDTVTISEHAASMGGSQCFFEAGEQQSVEDMIKCIEIASGNDAAVAMAEYVAGSEEQFVNMMNAKAKELGMVNTNFENACGLDADNHVTTARDIAIMSRELTTRYPQIYDYSGIWMDSIIHKTRRGESRFDLVNTNKFLNAYTGATGLKTGYTSEAGYCISATARRDNIELIAVIMSAETKEIRNSEAGKLFDYGFACCQTYEDKNVIEDDLKIEVSGGTKKYVDYRSPDELSFVVCNNDITKITKSITVDELKAPVHKDDKIGVVEYKIDNEVLYSSIIYADEDIEAISVNRLMLDIMRRLFLIR